MNTNRIIRGVTLAQERVDSKGLSADKIAEMSKQMDMDLTEYVMFQELKTLASQDGKLTLDEAQTVYAYLGETLEHFNGQPLAVKYTLTSVFKSLLGSKIASKVKQPHFVNE